MTSYDAGSARSRYVFDISSLKQGVAQAKALIRDLKAEAQALARIPAPGSSSGGGGRGRAPDLARTSREAERALKSFAQLERQYDRVRDSEIKAARATGDHAGAMRLVEVAIGRAIPDSVRYNQLLAQKAQLERAAAAEAQRAARVRPAAPAAPAGGGGIGGAGVLGVAGRALGAVGGVAAIAAFTREQGTAALALRRTDAVTRALTGTQANYNQALELARENQALYGGTLQENLAALGSLGILTRKTGIDMATLNDLSARLALIDPTQGFEGAAIGLREAFSGDITTLAERFEIPRSALRAMNDETLTGAERAKILNDVLNDMGVTSAAAGGAIDDTTQAYNRLGGSIERARLAFGGEAADMFAPAARGATLVTDALFDGERGANAFFNVLNRMAGNSIVAGQAQAQHTLAVTAYLSPAQQAARADAERTAALRSATRAHEEQAGATLEAGRASAAASIEQQALNIELERQQEAARSAANGLYASGAGASESGIQALLAAGKIDVLTAAFLRLRIAEAGGELGNRGGGGIGKTGGGGAQPTGGRIPLLGDAKGNAGANRDARAAFEERQRLAAEELAAARAADIQARETSAQRVARLRRELAASRAGTAEQVRKRTELFNAEQALAAEQTRGARSAPARVSAARSVAEATKDAAQAAKDLADEQERAARAAVDAQLAAIEDRKQRRGEAREIAAAQRVLASGRTSEEQKAAARDVLARIPLEQQARALEIASKQREAGGATGAQFPTTAAEAQRAGARAAAGLAPLTPPPLPAGAAQAAGGVGAPVTLNLSVLLDGEQIAARLEGDVSEGVIVRLSGDLEAVLSQRGGLQ